MKQVNKKKEQSEMLVRQTQIEWERARWTAVNIMNSMGAKLHSVYQLTTFPWESPAPKPTEDLLSKFPKTLK